MLGELAVPIWALAALGVLALVATVDRLIAPVTRMVLERRRVRRLDHLNRELVLPLSRFKFASRSSVVEQILREPDVQAAIDEEAARTGSSRAAALKQARRYAREIVPAFSTTLYFKVGARMAGWLSRLLYRVRIAASDQTALAGIDPSATVVFVINHRSNMDYVLVTHLVARSSALSYAVGEWARLPLLAGMIRLMGAYFIRRDSRNPLYRRVLSRYVRLATATGVTQAVFPEGGLSRTGSLQPPKLGLLAYIASAIEFMGDRDIVFVPVGVNYDRVLEDRVLIAAAATPKGERPRFAFNPGIFARFVGRNVWDRLTSEERRNGYACISFGRPVSLTSHLRNRGIDFRTLSEVERFAAVERLGEVLISEIGRAVPALPASLVAYAVLEASGPVSAFELKGAVHELMRRLERAGSPLYIPRADQEYAIDFGLRMLVGRKLIVQADGLLRAADNEQQILSFYANALVHHLGRAPWTVQSTSTVG